MCWSLWCLEQERGGKLEVVVVLVARTVQSKEMCFFTPIPTASVFLLATYCEFTYFLRIIFLKVFNYMRNILQIIWHFQKRIIFFSLII